MEQLWADCILASRPFHWLSSNTAVHSAARSTSRFGKEENRMVMAILHKFGELQHVVA